MNSIEIGRDAIRAESRGLDALVALLDDRFEQAVDLLASVSGRVICTGMGKSGQIAAKVASTMASTGTPAVHLCPAGAAHGDLGMLLPADGIFAISKSGLTAELDPVLDRAAVLGLPVVLVSERTDDGLASHAHVTIPTPIVAEAWGPAPTTSSTMQMALGDALAVALAVRRGFTTADFKALHPGGNIVA